MQIEVFVLNKFVAFHMRFLMQLLFCRAFHCNFLYPRAATSNPTCQLPAISVRFGRGGWG